MAYDDMNPIGAQGLEGIEHVKQHGTGSDGLQNFGSAGGHALALARGQEHDLEGTGLRHQKVL
jgi:hypothetical protein